MPDSSKGRLGEGYTHSISSCRNGQAETVGHWYWTLTSRTYRTRCVSSGEATTVPPLAQCLCLSRKRERN